VKLVLDACVLFPTVMREMLIGAAALGHYQPLWSARILEEWARAAARLGPAGEAQARSEIALLRAGWPGAEVTAAPGIEARLWLPDPADIHVLATAVTGFADGIVTMNRKDFPKHILAEEDLLRFDPDGFLYDLWTRDGAGMQQVGETVLATANRLSQRGDWEMRPLLKKARLPRLAKALGT